MFFFLGFLAVLISAALIFAVVIQNSKGRGLSSTFGGGASQIMGARRSNEFIEKITWYLAGALALIAFVANVVGSASNTYEAGGLRMSDRIEDQIIDQPVVPDASQFETLPSGGEGGDAPTE